MGSEAERRRNCAAWALLAVFVTAFVAQAVPHLRMQYGPTLDGYNAVTFAGHSRALREHGIVESRFGARTDPNDRSSTYARHPPMIYGITGASEAVLGEGPVALRLPFLAASVAAVVFVFLSLRTLLGAPLLAAVSVAAVFSSPMFRVFGAMPDTPMLGFAVASAILCAFVAQRDGSSVPRWIWAVLGVVAALTSWQAILFAAVIALLLWRQSRPNAAALAVGAVVGAVVTVGWIWWAYGSLGHVAAAAGARVGLSGSLPSVGAWVGRQIRYFRDGFPVVGVLAAPALVLGIAHRPTRSVTAAAVGVVAGYALVFRQGAHEHAYWNFWVLLPFAVGVAAVATRLARRARPALVVAPLAAVAVLTFVSGSYVERELDAGAVGGAALAAADWSGQDAAYHVGRLAGFELGYYTARPVVRVTDWEARELPAGTMVLDARPWPRWRVVAADEVAPTSAWLPDNVHGLEVAGLRR